MTAPSSPRMIYSAWWHYGSLAAALLVGFALSLLAGYHGVVWWAQTLPLLGSMFAWCLAAVWAICRD